MDDRVRFIHADVGLAEVGSSHTVHSISPANAGSGVLAEELQSPRERLVLAAVEAVSEGSVDRLAKTRETEKTA